MNIQLLLVGYISKNKNLSGFIVPPWSNPQLNQSINIYAKTLNNCSFICISHFFDNNTAPNNFLITKKTVFILLL